MGFFMEKKVHTTTITVFDRNSVYREVGELLHQHADNIMLRVGYPMKDQNLAIIFLILNMSTDELGALTGKLGQIQTVRVKSITLNV
jgi:putative iron-only hydrogenase system regulator